MKRKQGTSYCRVQNTVDLDLLSLLFAFSLHSAVCPCSRGKKMSREMSFFAQISNPCSELTLKLAAVCCRYFTTWCERSAHGRWKPSDKTTASRRTARKSGNVPFCNVCLACTCEGSKGSNDRSSRLRLWILVIIALEQKKKKTHRLPRELLNSLHHHHLEPFFHLVLASHPWVFCFFCVFFVFGPTWRIISSEKAVPLCQIVLNPFSPVSKR